MFDGLWQDELLDVASACGINFKKSVIHSVVEKEAKGDFKCENGRILLVGPFVPRVTLSEIRMALPAKNGAASPDGIIFTLLQRFPTGLEIEELRAAVALRGHNQSRDTFRRHIYKMGQRGQLSVKDALVQLPSPQNNAACPLADNTPINQAA